MSAKWIVKIVIIPMLLMLGFSYANANEKTSDYLIKSDQKEFDEMLFDGIIDSLVGLSLSQEKVGLIKTAFSSYRSKVCGS